jgi:tRNA(Ile)-lysidine synthase
MFKINYIDQKNLLAFSGGIDSSALFFLLLENNIEFDIAIVDYGQREESKKELEYALSLAKKYEKKCFIKEFPKELTFNEKTAREFRYSFFDSLMQQHYYSTLLTAHQLNDKLEWFLMQLTRGAGLKELLGMEEINYKDTYKIYKPLLDYSKEYLLNYLQKNNYIYFEDSSNQDEKYRRNYFRHNFSDKLINEYQEGIKNSFHYLQDDLQSLIPSITPKILEELHLYTFNKDLNIAIKLIDSDLKKRGVLLSKNTRDEILTKKQVVVSHKFAVAIQKDTIFIAPYNKNITMDKSFKESCRIKKIPANIRGYLYSLKEFNFSVLESLLELDKGL